MIHGTHNSGTGGRLVWWQRPFAFILNCTSRCQERSIAEQVQDNVKLFNLQVTYYKGEWHFSHGLCIYEERLFEALGIMRAAADKKAPIYFQLCLDKNFICGQKRELFLKLVKDIKDYYCAPHFVMLSAWIEGSDIYPHKSKKVIDKREHYWTKAWGKSFGKSFIDRLPLPLRHAKLYNAKYRKECESKYLMLDFYNR
ncbi:MAG: hypothetical protein IJZ22_04415 [Bacteroidaceae bacterium]|nr:hypothetical protein [Bacteroidaceae bacterium]